MAYTYSCSSVSTGMSSRYLAADREQYDHGYCNEPANKCYAQNRLLDDLSLECASLFHRIYDKSTSTDCCYIDNNNNYSCKYEKQAETRQLEISPVGSCRSVKVYQENGSYTISPAAVFKTTSTCTEERMSPRRTWTAPARSLPTQSARGWLAKPLSCRRCTKTVFEAEKVMGAGNVWHKSCFRCRECGKSLEMGKFCDRDGEIFCEKCYAKNFGPKGVGCGVGAGILQMHQ